MNRHAAEHTAVRVEGKAGTSMVAGVGVDLACPSWGIYGGRGLFLSDKPPKDKEALPSGA